MREELLFAYPMPFYIFHSSVLHHVSNWKKIKFDDKKAQSREQMFEQSDKCWRNRSVDI